MDSRIVVKELYTLGGLDFAEEEVPVVILY